jgi:1,3-propanediol dehydrogenase
MNIFKFMAPEIIFGPGSLAKIGDSAIRLGASRLLLVTDEGLTRAGWVEKALAFVEEQGIPCTLWSGVTPNPKDYEVSEGASRYLEAGCDAIAALGGGSPIDAAKGVAVLVSNGGRLKDYEGVNKITRPLPPMVMAASTAGSGADVSQFAIITDTRRRAKMALISKSLIPDISITDPLLLTTTDRSLRAGTGMDALAHAIEAYVSVAATPLTDVLALNAARLAAKYLRRAVDDPADAEASEGMAMASLQAGLAFSNAILGATHAMAHQLGGLLDLPHGEVDGILLPHVMEYNLPAAARRYADIAVAMAGEQACDGDPALAGRAIELVRRLSLDIGLPQGLEAVGVRKEDIPRLSANAVNDACLITNPRPASVFDIAEIFRRAL